MDTFAAAVAVSLLRGGVTAPQVARLTLAFGFFQAGMTLLGWLAGSTIEPWIESWDHWLAFALLALIGGKAVVDGWMGNGSGMGAGDPTRGVRLLILSIATSIDALAIGVGFGVMTDKIILPSAVIGATAALFTLVGAALGKRVGNRFGHRAEIAAGLILIAIGAKIVVDHMA